MCGWLTSVVFVSFVLLSFFPSVKQWWRSWKMISYLCSASTHSLDGKTYATLSQVWQLNPRFCISDTMQELIFLASPPPLCTEWGTLIMYINMSVKYFKIFCICIYYDIQKMAVDSTTKLLVPFMGLCMKLKGQI